MVDYLKLLHPATKCENRNLEVAGMSAALKSLAMKTGAAVVVLSQLSRAAAEGKPALSALRDSGAIEQDVDLAMLLWRKDDDASVVPVHCDVAKNRNGPTFPCVFDFHKRTMRFSDATISASDEKGH